MRNIRYFLILFVLIQSKFSFSQNNLPEATLRNISGKNVNFSELTAQSEKHPVVFSFWATWCIPCVAELRNISDELKEKQSESPFTFNAISVDDSRTANRVRSFVKGEGWNFDVYQDINSELKRVLNITDIPHVLIIRSGKIVYRHTGYVAGEEDNLFDEINAGSSFKNYFSLIDAIGIHLYQLEIAHQSLLIQRLYENA